MEVLGKRQAQRQGPQLTDVAPVSCTHRQPVQTAPVGTDAALLTCILLC